MKDFKIRVWNKMENKYHFPSDMAETGAFLVLAGMDQGNYQVDRFTGAKDVNKVDIYEGDKITCHFQTHKDNWDEMTGKSIGTVKFDNTLSQFRVFFKGRHGKIDSQTLEKHHGHVVIGK